MFSSNDCTVFFYSRKGVHDRKALSESKFSSIHCLRLTLYSPVGDLYVHRTGYYIDAFVIHRILKQHV